MLKIIEIPASLFRVPKIVVRITPATPLTRRYQLTAGLHRMGALMSMLLLVLMHYCKMWTD